MKIKIKSPFENQKVKEAVASLEQTEAKVVDYLIKLSPRERFSVIGGTIFVVLFILIAVIIGPLLHSKSKLDKAIALNDQQLRKIYVMSANIKAFDAVSKGNKDARFTLISYLEELSKQLSISDRVEYMKPISDSTEANRESVEVKIRGLYQDDLIGLLFGIESSRYPIKIKRFNLRKAEKGDVLDVTFQVVSYG
jgi:hypothetical protein